MRRIEYEMLSRDLLDAQRKALQKAAVGDLDGALHISQGYYDSLGESKLPPQKLLLLQRLIDIDLRYFEAGHHLALPCEFCYNLR
jgi:hypothetical protein